MTRPLSRIIGITFSIQLFIFIFGVANYVILSRWLGPEMLGLIATAAVIIDIIFKVANLGLDTSAVYFISNNRFPVKKYIGNYFFNAAVVFFAGVILLTLLIHSDNIVKLTYGINSDLISKGLSALVVYYFAFLMYEFGMKIPLGLQEFKSFNQYQLVKPITLFALLILSSNLFDAQFNLVLFLIGISWLIPAAIIWLRQVPFDFGFNKEITLRSIGYGVKVMLNNLLQFLIYRADILLIGFFLSQTEVGWYYIAVIVAERLLYLTQATAMIFLPAASHSDEQYKKTPILTRTNLFVVVIASIFVALLSPWFIPVLFSESYVNAILPLILLLPGIASLSVVKILFADFAARGIPQYSTYVSTVNFCLNIVLNLYLIPRMGIVGAALSSSISYTTAVVLQCYFYKRFTNTPIKELIFLKREDFKSLKKI